MSAQMTQSSLAAPQIRQHETCSTIDIKNPAGFRSRANCELKLRCETAASNSLSEEAEFAWKLWALDWNGPLPGEHGITSRAVDTAGRIQPAMNDPSIVHALLLTEEYDHAGSSKCCPDASSTQPAQSKPGCHFQTWLACFLSEMATARFGRQHAFPGEVWRSPNARDEPPSDPRGVIRITRKLYLKNPILRDSAIE